MTQPRWRKALPVHARNALALAEDGHARWRARADDYASQLGAALNALGQANATIKRQNRTIQAVAKALISHLPKPRKAGEAK